MNATPPILERLTVQSWNIGYAGLGAGADSRTDGGRRQLPESRGEVAANLDGINATLAAQGYDIVFLQEVAGPSLMTKGVDVRGAIENRLSHFQSRFFPGSVSRLPIGPLKIVVGSLVAACQPVLQFEELTLPGRESFARGLVKRRFPAGIARLPGWVLVNVHLSAFDAQAALRKAQLGALFDFATREYELGNHVVLGGDWNLRLAPTNFAHRTDPFHLSWYYDFPQDLRPGGWHIAIDESVPTVRTLHQPFARGDNYTTIVDGFILSPNISVEEVRTEDFGFTHSDHNPVAATLIAGVR